MGRESLRRKFLPQNLQIVYNQVPYKEVRKNYQSEVNMGPYEYVVEKIDGDYAVLRRTDIQSEDTVLVARALLPDETDEGTRLLWENLEYSVI